MQIKAEPDLAIRAEVEEGAALLHGQPLLLSHQGQLLVLVLLVASMGNADNDVTVADQDCAVHDD